MGSRARDARARRALCKANKPAMTSAGSTPSLRRPFKSLKAISRVRFPTTPAKAFAASTSGRLKPRSYLSPARPMATSATAPSSTASNADTNSGCGPVGCSHSASSQSASADASPHRLWRRWLKRHANSMPHPLQVTRGRSAFADIRRGAIMTKLFERSRPFEGVDDGQLKVENLPPASVDHVAGAASA